MVSYEAIRQWCRKFGSEYARRLKRRQGRLGDIWHLDEVFVTIQGKRYYLWRAVDQDGCVLDILVQCPGAGHGFLRSRARAALLAPAAAGRRRFGSDASENGFDDIGERKDVVEPAIEQKRIADLFHANGEMTGSIDYQIAEGDLVATRWQWRFRPTSLRFRVMGGKNPVPIINVFRFRDGRIVEIWNHRHDIDTGLGNFAFVRGLAVGLAVALLGVATVFVFRRRAKRLAKAKA